MGFVNWKVHIELTDTRSIIGVLMAFDKHMNIVLGESEEIRLVVPAKVAGQTGAVKPVEEKRLLGLILLRGNQVTSMKPLAPPAIKTRLPVGAQPASASMAGPVGMPGARPPMMVGGPLMVPRPGMPMMPPRPGMMMPMMPMPGMPMGGPPMMAGRGGGPPLPGAPPPNPQ